ncbi:DUF6233 domain-containing protein [Streptomyces kanasensis]|uniref:DUF6233 domain-containing protein n=1 Tax=Streptomyces kanasensis TaxID=936756 RepID=UPI003702D684
MAVGRRQTKARAGKLPEDAARRALAEGVPACVVCRPDTDLGIPNAGEHGTGAAGSARYQPGGSPAGRRPAHRGRPGLRAVERPGRRPRRQTECRATDPTTGRHGLRTTAIQAGARPESGGTPGSGGQR